MVKSKFLLAAIAILFSIVALVLLSQTSLINSSVPVPTDTPLPRISTSTFDIRSRNYRFSLPEIRVPLGSMVRVNLINDEGFHDWAIDEFNAKTKQLTAAQSDSVEFIANKVGTFEYYCSVGNHRSQGMVGKLIVQ
jgi:nitrite reductase (NO-forming)